jgi:hypothetical protein
MKPWRTAVAITALLMVAGTACNNTAPNNTEIVDPPIATREAPPPVDGQTSPTPTAEVPAELMFEATLLGGGKLSGSDLAGTDLAVWFWAPW